MIRVIHAAGNAGTITSTFTYTAVEFPNSVARIFVSRMFDEFSAHCVIANCTLGHSICKSLTRTMMNIAQLAGPIVGGALYEAGGFKTPFILMGGIQTVMAFVTLPFLPDYDGNKYRSLSLK